MRRRNRIRVVLLKNGFIHGRLENGRGGEGEKDEVSKSPVYILLIVITIETLSNTYNLLFGHNIQ